MTCTLHASVPYTSQLPIIDLEHMYRSVPNSSARSTITNLEKTKLNFPIFNNINNKAFSVIPTAFLSFQDVLK